MAIHNNKNIIENANQIFKSKAREEIGKEVFDVVSPVIEIKPYINVYELAQGQAYAGFSIPEDKEFYLYGFSIFLLDSTGTTANFQFMQENGISYQIPYYAPANIPITTTQTFGERGIKIKSGSLILFNNATDNANSHVVFWGVLQ